jgi:alkaline phosphatase D
MATFSHGVASGDPARDGAVIWTRVTTGEAAREVPVSWTVSAGGRRVAQGRTTASAARDHTVKVVVGRLRPGTEYSYAFTAGAASSPTGRFRTLPERAEDVVLAVASCSLHPGGLFNAYDAIAKLPRVDAVVHLGDYIYEYGAAAADYGVTVGRTLNRIPDPPTEIVTLADYRRRHAQYKSDPDLQAAHARAAWIVTWDDHEPPTTAGWAAPRTTIPTARRAIGRPARRRR